MKIIALILHTLLFLPLASAKGVVLTGGGNVISNQTSDQKDSAGLPYLDMYAGWGLNFDAELPVSDYFLLNGSLGFSQSKGKVQYHHVADNLPDARATDLKTITSFVRAMGGPRIRLINFKFLKLFVGAGAMIGNMDLNFSKSDYRQKNAFSEVNFKDEENQGFWGTYVESGIDIIVSKKSAFRLGARYEDLQTARFDTLNKKFLDVNFLEFNVYYMHWFDFKVSK